MRLDPVRFRCRLQRNRPREVSLRGSVSYESSSGWDPLGSSSNSVFGIRFSRCPAPFGAGAASSGEDIYYAPPRSRARAFPSVHISYIFGEWGAGAEDAHRPRCPIQLEAVGKDQSCVSGAGCLRTPSLRTGEPHARAPTYRKEARALPHRVLSIYREPHTKEGGFRAPHATACPCSGPHRSASHRPQVRRRSDEQLERRLCAKNRSPPSTIERAEAGAAGNRQSLASAPLQGVSLQSGKPSTERRALARGRIGRERSRPHPAYTRGAVRQARQIRQRNA